MTPRSVFLSTAAACAALLATSVQAHDPSLHEPTTMPAKTKPVSCVQLDDTQRYSSDLTDPDIKALKARCDAEKSAATRKAAAKPATSKIK